jgi:hypothetical protein
MEEKCCNLLVILVHEPALRRQAARIEHQVSLPWEGKELWHPGSLGYRLVLEGVKVRSNILPQFQLARCTANGMGIWGTG